MSVGALLGFDESQLPANEREVLRVLVVELGATLTEGVGGTVMPNAAEAGNSAQESATPSVSVDQLTIEEAA